MNIKTAFLNSPQVHAVWERFHAGYEHPYGHTFAKLDKSLYDLKQYAVEFYALQHTRVLSFHPDIYRSIAEPCLYYIVKDGVHKYLMVHVDDYVGAYSDPDYFAERLQHFRGEPATDSFLDVKMLGDVGIVRTQSTLCMDHELQITKLAIGYGVQD